MTMTSALDPALSLIVEPLPYVELLEKRSLAQIDLVVMHCTELPDMTMARDYGDTTILIAMVAFTNTLTPSILPITRADSIRVR